MKKKIPGLLLMFGLGFLLQNLGYGLGNWQVWVIFAIFISFGIVNHIEGYIKGFESKIS